jgi:CRP/FNR family transcriptional regulator
MRPLALPDHPVFGGAPAEQVGELLAAVRPHSYAAGDTVTTPVSGGGLGLVLDGLLSVFEVTPDGRRIILDHVGPGGMYGVIGQGADQGHFAEAVADSVVATIPEMVLSALVHAAPAVGLNLLSAMGRRLRRREEQVERLSMRDPCQRLAAQLLALAARAEARLSWSPRLSHEALADMVGLRRETVTLHLGKLRRLGAVRVERDRFLLDTEFLAALRDGHRPYLRSA